VPDARQAAKQLPPLIVDDEGRTSHDGLVTEQVATVTSIAPIPVRQEAPTVERVKAWLAEHLGMIKAIDLELAIARDRVAELEQLKAELERVKP
jgi:hypothetical protein